MNDMIKCPIDAVSLSTHKLFSNLNVIQGQKGRGQSKRDGEHSSSIQYLKCIKE